MKPALWILGGAVTLVALKALARGRDWGSPLDRALSVTSPFGNRIDPFGTGKTVYHNGIDLAAEVGTPALAVADGEIQTVGYDDLNGNYIRVMHENSTVAAYAHLSAVADEVAPGAQVNRGQVIALTGVTGAATGPHLHFGVQVGSIWVNPGPYLGL